MPLGRLPQFWGKNLPLSKQQTNSILSAWVKRQRKQEQLSCVFCADGAKKGKETRPNKPRFPKNQTTVQAVCRVLNGQTRTACTPNPAPSLLCRWQSREPQTSHIMSGVGWRSAGGLVRDAPSTPHRHVVRDGERDAELDPHAERPWPFGGRAEVPVQHRPDLQHQSDEEAQAGPVPSAPVQGTGQR